MSESVSKIIANNAKLFDEQLKPELAKYWGGVMLSIEGQSDSALADIFDRGGSSDLILSYLKTKGPTLTVASRFAFSKPDTDGQTNFVKYDLDFTFRCSYLKHEGEIGFDCELEKLIKSFNLIAQGIPVIVPFYYVKARFLTISPDQFKLYDYAIAETRNLIDAVTGANGINWSESRKRITYEFMKDPKNLQGNKQGCGINFNKIDKKGFAYINLKHLSSAEVPFLYVWPHGNQLRLHGDFFRKPTPPNTSLQRTEDGGRGFLLGRSLCILPPSLSLFLLNHLHACPRIEPFLFSRRASKSRRNYSVGGWHNHFARHCFSLRRSCRGHPPSVLGGRGIRLPLPASGRPGHAALAHRTLGGR